MMVFYFKTVQLSTLLTIKLCMAAPDRGMGADAGQSTTGTSQRIRMHGV